MSALLADHEAYAEQQDLARRVVRAATNDRETVDLYFEHARERARLPDVARRAIDVLGEALDR